ncbi:MAG: response regulator [Polyangiaceae bacterium]
MSSAKDPYKYFRIEARELCENIGRGILDLEKLPADPQLIPRLLRYAHTLKGAARVVKLLEIAARAHSLEEILLPKRDGQAQVTREETQALLALVDQISGIMAGLGEFASPPAVSVPDAPAPPAERDSALTRVGVSESYDALRVDVEQMDSLLRSVANAGQRMAGLSRELTQLDHLGRQAALLAQMATPVRQESGLSATASGQLRSLARDLASELERLKRGLDGAALEVEGELRDVHETAHQLRLLPASTLFPAVERVLFDAAAQLGKRVQFTSQGGEVRLDAHVLGSLRDALLHVVRNAVAHGIETPEQRRAAGKSERGVVTLSIQRSGNRVKFGCSDDGRGIDREAVRRVAVERGLVAEVDARRLSDAEVSELLMRSGLSTSREVTEIAGHGIGLDVVKEATARLKGSVHVESVPGSGTRIELEVPVSLALVPSLMVEVRGARLAIPLEAVAATARVQQSELGRSQDRECVLHEGQPLPFFPLERVLPGAEQDAVRAMWSLVMLRWGGRGAALGVDRVLGTSNVVMRAMPSLVRAHPVVAGAALDAEGNPQLVLEPRALIERAESHVATRQRAEVRALPPILVIDDSLTTRMLEQSILRSAGYEVDIATSAEEGLEKARLKRYGLFLVDVEMPGMNGFEFVATTRADAELSATPAILVTSRDEPDDRQRGARAGARAYIVKGEFEQQHLLRTIRSLMG